MGLVRRLGFGFDPEAIGRRPLRLALEVYPHPALVSLFALPRTLKYKAKRGRTLAGRRREFERLVTALRRLADFAPRLRVTSGPGWERLEESVHRADSGAALDRVEDELDAHLCAYVGLYHLRWRGVRSMTVGDARGGYVVTPVDPGRTAALRAKAQELGVTIA
jgi:predicted RNase H-like nuclease